VLGGDPLGALRLLRPVLAGYREPAVLELAGRAYFASAQLGRAETVLRELVAARPDDAYARLLLGRTLQRQGRRTAAGGELRLAAAMGSEYRVHGSDWLPSGTESGRTGRRTQC